MWARPAPGSPGRPAAPGPGSPVSVGFMSLFKIESIKTDKSFFKNSVIDNLKLLAILQFVVGVYTFPIWIEILLVPVLALISAMLAIAENEKNITKSKTF